MPSQRAPPKTMAKMLLKAQKYMNAKDVLAAIGEESRPKGKTKRDARGKGMIVRPASMEISKEMTKFRRW